MTGFINGWFSRNAAWLIALIIALFSALGWLVSTLYGLSQQEVEIKTRMEFQQQRQQQMIAAIQHNSERIDELLKQVHQLELIEQGKR